MVIHKIDEKTDSVGTRMFALKDIPAGGIILLPEHPAIIMPVPSFPRGFGAYEALYEALPESTRTDILKMANWKSEEECCLEEGIARTTKRLSCY
jgi:hypothetical protein